MPACEQDAAVVVFWGCVLRFVLGCVCSVRPLSLTTKHYGCLIFRAVLGVTYLERYTVARCLVLVVLVTEKMFSSH